MQIEHTIVINAPPERIFVFYADVANWSRWDPDTKSSHIDSAFQVGAKGFLTPVNGNTVPIILTEVTPNRSFTAEAKIPLFHMVFAHELHAAGPDTTRVVHRVTFSGARAFLLGRVMGSRVNAGLPVTLAKLKTHVEASNGAA
jgi:uncharacterized protein YndB with AHSA1/START domain